MSKPSDLLKLNDVPSILAELRYPEQPGEQDSIVLGANRLAAENSYKSLLDRAILEGHLMQRDHAGIPIPRHHKVWHGGYVLRVGLQHMLDVYRVPIQLDGPPEIESNPSPVMPKQRWQEEKVVETLQILGYDPTAMPPFKRGKSGVKAKVRKMCSNENPNAWIGTKIFDKAWERCTKLNMIAYENKK